MKFKRTITWIIFNTLFGGCVYLGTIQGNEHAENVIVFLVPFLLIMTIITFSVVEVREKLNKRGRSIPAVISRTFDVVVTMLFAASGWFWIAGMYAAQAVFEAAIFHKDEDLEKS